MSQGGTNKTSVGAGLNSGLNTISTTGSELNTQLQGILGSASTSPITAAGSTAMQNYSDIATTGGYTPTQVSSLEDQATQGAESAYSTAGDAYKRAVSASGGYGPSADATMSLAREGANAGGISAGNVASNVAQSQIGNKLQANQGLTNLAGLSQQQIQGFINAILGNNAQTENATNTNLGIQEHIAMTPNPLWGNIANIIAAMGKGASGAADLASAGG